VNNTSRARPLPPGIAVLAIVAAFCPSSNLTHDAPANLPESRVQRLDVFQANMRGRVTAGGAGRRRLLGSAAFALAAPALVPSAASLAPTGAS
jgi:hypothetical protein